MDYQCLDAMVYQNSRYALIELFSEMSAGSRGWVKKAPDLSPAFFRRLDKQERQALFNSIAEVCEARIDRFVAGIPPSEERLALFSMAYDGFDFSDEALRAALIAGDRETAWMCIRHARASLFTVDRMPYNRSRYEAEIFGR